MHNLSWPAVSMAGNSRENDFFLANQPRGKLLEDEKIQIIIKNYLPLVKSFVPLDSYQDIIAGRHVDPVERKAFLKMIKNLFYCMIQQQGEGLIDAFPHLPTCRSKIYFENTSIQGREAGVAFSKGRRDYMEDRHLMQEIKFKVGNREINGEVYGVFDGHAGQDTARFVRSNLALALKNSLEEYNSQSLSFNGVYRALTSCCQNLNRDIFNIHKVSKKDRSGTTASIVLIAENTLYCANVGDSKIFLVNKKSSPDQTTTYQTLLLSEDPKPNPNTRHSAKVKKLGGKIGWNSVYQDWRVNGIINMTRALGDHFDAKGQQFKGMSGNPLITFYPLQEIDQGLLVIASDGALEKGHNTNSLGEYIGRYLEEGANVPEIANSIVREAILNGSEDNITALLIPIQNIAEES